MTPYDRTIYTIIFLCVVLTIGKYNETITSLEQRIQVLESRK